MVRDIFQEQNLEINFKRLLFLRGINHLETRREVSQIRQNPSAAAVRDEF